MPPMGVDNLNLCAIISACAKGGVSELKFGVVEVRFFNPTSTPTHDTPAMAIGAVTQFQEISATPESGRPTSVNSFDRELLDDLRLSQLMIDDPQGFEREIVNSHLRGDYETVQN